MKAGTIFGSSLLVFRNVNTSTPEADLLWATIPKDYDGKDQFDGKECDLHDWRWDKETSSIYIRASIFLGLGAGYYKFEGTFPARHEIEKLKAPNKNYEWSSFMGEWRNVKTGARRQAA